jgi:valyl-tRNA synthetase
MRTFLSDYVSGEAVFSKTRYIYTNDPVLSQGKKLAQNCIKTGYLVELLPTMELSKVYTPSETEKQWYENWENRGYFKPRTAPQDAPAFAIVIPPPNVTGSLHMGHALNDTLQDILTRWRRMAGDKTVWVPGTDHGGIATQNVVEKLLQKEKMTRHDLGRDRFLERMWQWRKESGDTILHQLRRLGASCDWSRTRFTMDEVFSRAVRTAFVELFNQGLIYKGPRMVNWCPKDQTALADIEVEHEQRPGKLWYIRYPLATGTGHVVVATTRPETMLGDTAVAVNPTDTRYKDLIGKRLRLPLMNREIPIVGDAAIDASFGTGAVKVTPAHDATDFDIAERQKLPHEVVIDFQGKMTAKAGAYAGLDRFEARKRVVEDLDAQGLLEKTDDYTLAAAVCYRCGTIVEPLVSEQWFLSMRQMAAQAAEATRDGRVKIFPSSWEKPYLNWLDNIRDWCISRQIWWGHQIPVYYCQSGKCKPFAAVEKPAHCPQCQGDALKQDPDVLDTWFSSGLWPFGVFGWPDEGPDLKTFYPTSVLVTGHEILYLWVARMVMLGLQFRKDVPFRHVYIHGIVRDKKGKKMSKSLGNVIDPLEIMAKFGTDALRFSLSTSSIPGRDMQLSDDSFLRARNFANKLWNASRFVLMNLEGYKPQPLPHELALADRWILHELQETVQAVTQALECYNPADASRVLYEFIWGALCDWFLEISKVALTGSDARAKIAKQAVLVHLLEKSLSLLHPFMPFETEELYQAFKPYLPTSADSIMIAPWPQVSQGNLDQSAADKMHLVQDVVTAIRTVRSESVIPPGTPVDCFLRNLDPKAREIIEDPTVSAFIVSLARLGQLDTSEKTKPEEYLFTVFNGGEIFIPSKGLVDKEKEKARLKKNLLQLEQMLQRGQAALDNQDFIQKAPKEEVESRRQTLRQTRQKIEWLNRNLEGLS